MGAIDLLINGKRVTRYFRNRSGSSSSYEEGYKPIRLQDDKILDWSKL